jgi:hypothetical protein
MLGKGPTFARRVEHDLGNYNLLTLNHAVRELDVDIAHVIDIDVIHDCEDVIVDRCKFLVMPGVPHVRSRVGHARLEEYLRASPALQRLDSENRLIWYNAETGPRIGPSPKIGVRYFSSEAALGVLGVLGAATVRSLGVDGGTAYAKSFSDLAGSTLLSNGQPSFDLQFGELRRISRRFGIDYRPLVEPLRVFVGAGPDETVPYRVLAHSIHRHSTVPVRVEPLTAVSSPMPSSKANRPRTAFSFSRFHIPELCDYRGRAVYLDSDMVVFGDIGELADYPLDTAWIACTTQDRPAAWTHDKAFRPGRQFSVMVLDCEQLDWRISDIVAGLDRGAYTYQDLMFDLCIVPVDRIDDQLDRAWNSLEHHDSTTRLIHYTVVPTQPWKVVDNPNGELWMTAYRQAVRDGVVPRDEVEQMVRSGCRGDLLDAFDDIPVAAPAHARNVTEVALDAAYRHLDATRSASMRGAARRRAAVFSPLLRRLRTRTPDSSIVRTLDRVADRLRRALG